MSLQDLSDDVLLEIYMNYLDAVDVIRLETLCRRLRDSTQSRQLWLNFLHELDLDHAPDLPSHINIDSLCLREIRSLVIGAIRGFFNWHYPYGPVYSREERIPSEVIYAEPGFGKVLSVKLVPGERFLVAQRFNGSFQLWNISSKSLVATYQPRDPDSPQTLPAEYQEYDFVVNISEDRGDARLLVSTNYLKPCAHDKRTSVFSSHQIFQVNVVDISLTSGEIKERFSSSFRERPIRSLDIDSDFIGFILNSPYVAVVCRWKTGEMVVVDQGSAGTHRHVSCIRLMHNHVFVIEREEWRLTIHILNLSPTFLASSVDLGPYLQVLCQEGSDAQFSIIYTNWKPEAERAIFVRVLTVLHSNEAKVCTYEVTEPFLKEPEPRPETSLLLQERDVSLLTGVDTGVTGRFVPTQISRSGRVLVTPDIEGIITSRVPDFWLVSVRWTSSLWSLRDQWNYWSDDEKGFDTWVSGKMNGPDPKRRRCNPPPVPLLRDIHAPADEPYLRLDELSGAVHTADTSVEGEIAIWYL